MGELWFLIYYSPNLRAPAESDFRKSAPQFSTKKPNIEKCAGLEWRWWPSTLLAMVWQKRSNFMPLVSHLCFFALAHEQFSQISAKPHDRHKQLFSYTSSCGFTSQLRTLSKRVRVGPFRGEGKFLIVAHKHTDNKVNNLWEDNAVSMYFE